MNRLSKLIKRIDTSHVEVIIPLLIFLIVSPIIYLYIRDGVGNAVFPFHDQLDETVLSYCFTARYFGKTVFEQMFSGGVPSTSLKPNCYLFIPLYRIFSVYVAFFVQYIIVVSTAFFGMFFCLKKVFKVGSISALLTGFIFAFLPFHSVYGNAVAGTPLVILCIFSSFDKTKKIRIFSYLGLVYYALSAGVVLSGWIVLGIVLALFVVLSIRKRKISVNLLISFATLFIPYVLCNIDLIKLALGVDSFVSHRVELGFGGNGDSFIQTVRNYFFNGTFQYEAESKHIMIYIAVIAALVIMVVFRSYKTYLKTFIILFGSVTAIIMISVIFHLDYIKRILEGLGGILSSFDFERVYYLLPGLWYLLLGYCGEVIIKSFKERFMFAGLLVMAAIMFVCFYNLAKDKNGIFYQNVNQINNGENVTGYITMKNAYAEKLMEQIDGAIGKDKSTYRVIHIGVSPVVSLINGFYTVDGYSNNYPLEYKHRFREVIADELELNEYNKAYFDCWGSRCYAFYHEWGNAYMLRKGFEGKIDDLRLNMEKLKGLDCEYIFSAGEIIDPEKYGLRDMGYFEDEESYWGIYVYEIR